MLCYVLPCVAMFAMCCYGFDVFRVIGFEVWWYFRTRWRGGGDEHDHVGFPGLASMRISSKKI